MSRLSDLLRVASQLDPQLAKDLEEEIQPLQKRLPFGLNFERHAPEAVELAGHKIRKGSKVRILPPRGTGGQGDRRLWRVESIADGEAVLSTPASEDVETSSAPLDDLLLVAEFRDRIYPGLRPDGEVARGGDKPFHTVINGENFHVLEQLTFTHERAVDAIYIDPPYNTGARDWKYNNDYVEGDDLYRHSKWLAFMERRLKLAKRLLKPANSVLIVSIDEKEYLRLGLLLEQTFPEADIQMVSSQINPAASARMGSFGRVDEYIYFVRLGGLWPSVLPCRGSGFRPRAALTLERHGGTCCAGLAVVPGDKTLPEVSTRSTSIPPAPKLKQLGHRFPRGSRMRPLLRALSPFSPSARTDRKGDGCGAVRNLSEDSHRGGFESAATRDAALSSPSSKTASTPRSSTASTPQPARGPTDL
ncbi:DNA methyltransferase [Microbacterium sp. NPDC076768]|uniref:DNA methyltransferase n=1 Tax=Microbacterium sp. NPDC076768 TaxID=3154858 RepID=UPI003427D14C